MQPYITTTVTGAVLSMIEKGLAWYEKKHKKKLSEPQQTKQSKTDSPDQANDTTEANSIQIIEAVTGKTAAELQRIVATPWVPKE